MRLALVVVLALCGCVAHERLGDKAAVLGDWSTALSEYREALSDEADSVKLKQKYEAAKKEAVATALRDANACVIAANFDCVLSKAQYVRSIDAGNVDAAAMQLTASKAIARQHLATAQQLAGRRQARAGFAALARATQASSDPEVMSEASVVRTALVQGALSEAADARSAKRYPDAIGLLEMVASVDGAHAPLLLELKSEFETYRAQQYERLAVAGDGALSAHQWNEAAQLFRQALEWNQGGSAELRLRYATEVAAGDVARASKQLAAATDAYGRAVATGVDPAVSGYAAAQLQAINAEYEQMCLAGDAAIAARDWGAALRHYGTASQWRPGGRADALGAYAAEVDAGERATAQRDFRSAALSFRRAVATGVDNAAGGYAAARLDVVEVRPYAIRFSELAVAPVTPAGLPWVGPRSPFLGNLMKLAVGVAIPGVGATLAAGAIDAYQKVPPENRPLIWLELKLPDGRIVNTPQKKELYATYDAEFVVETNQLDARVLHIRVLGQGDHREDVAQFDLQLGDLVKNGGFTGRERSATLLHLLASVAPGASDGEVSGLAFVTADDNQASATSPARRGAIGFQLTSVDAVVMVGDYAAELMDGAPDPFVTIEQRGQQVFRSPVVRDSYQAHWAPSLTYLFVEPGEVLRVRVWDKDASDDDLVLQADVSTEALASGAVQLPTPNGGSLTLKFTQRRSGP